MAKSQVKHALTVKVRDTHGTRPVRRLRRQGLIPGVVYGKSTEPISVMVGQREMSRLLREMGGEHAMVTLRLDGAADGKKPQGWEKPALIEEVQHHPVDGHILHIDFRAVSLTERVRVPVAVELKGEPVGVKQDGGILEQFLREIEIECLPTEIPNHLELDVNALTIGQSLHVRDLKAPEGTRILTEPDVTIASVQAQREEKPEEEAAAVTEPEVIREKKEKTEGEEGAEGGAEKTEKAEKPEKSEEKGKK